LLWFWLSALTKPFSFAWTWLTAATIFLLFYLITRLKQTVGRREDFRLIFSLSNCWLVSETFGLGGWFQHEESFLLLPFHPLSFPLFPRGQRWPHFGLP
jgi:hypothetical protein